MQYCACSSVGSQITKPMAIYFDYDVCGAFPRRIPSASVPHARPRTQENDDAAAPDDDDDDNDDDEDLLSGRCTRLRGGQRTVLLLNEV